MAVAIGERRTRPRHHGDSWDLFGIHVRNLVFTVLTLGVYRFWAKTRVRRYLWSHTSFEDDRLEYTGTGKELFLGFLIVVGVLIVVLGAYSAAFTWIWPDWFDDQELQMLYNTPLWIGTIVLVGIARFRARRYRLSRTLWRGVRGAQTGSAIEYGFRELAYWLLTFLTLGFYWPYLSTRLAGYKLNNTWFGDRRFTFDGVGDALLGRFALCWLLTLPTLGLCWFWYRAAALRYFASRTRYEDLRFEINVDGRSLMRLIVTNLLLTIFTLGLASAYVMIRIANFITENLEIVGEQDFAGIAQSLRPLPGTGEGLADAFDVGEF